MDGHAMWQIISHDFYMIATIIGVVVVLFWFARTARRGREKHLQRARDERTKK